VLESTNMTLATHAVVGAGVASAFGLMPGGAFCAGFASHFLLDRLPHWDYELKSATINKVDPLKSTWTINRQATRDFIKISFDLLLGFSLALIFFAGNGQGYWLSILFGAFGGMLPDGLQFLYLKLRREPLTLFFRFHSLMHSSIKIKNTFWGLFLTALVFSFALILGNWRFFI